MKKILVPKQLEEATYFSDFTGEPFGDLFHPPVTLKLEFNYGSKYDSSEITLHLSDKDVEPILDLIKSRLNPDVQKILKEAFQENDEELQNAIEARDPRECELRINNNKLFNKLLDNEIS
jgi:hypothetical protein